MEMPSSGSVLPVYPDHWKSPTANNTTKLINKKWKSKYSQVLKKTIVEIDDINWALISLITGICRKRIVIPSVSLNFVDTVVLKSSNLYEEIGFVNVVLYNRPIRKAQITKEENSWALKSNKKKHRHLWKVVDYPKILILKATGVKNNYNSMEASLSIRLLNLTEYLTFPVIINSGSTVYLVNEMFVRDVIFPYLDTSSSTVSDN
ncbi:hypothetical protein H8356DRAFT_1422902 [Neocallimastix lanati (nom. inval.)]|nr:hypothetical protein H8356DRAFT_1422902 [Neocallimastix sp. JGI-2020a]